MQSEEAMEFSIPRMECILIPEKYIIELPIPFPQSTLYLPVLSKMEGGRGFIKGNCRLPPDARHRFAVISGRKQSLEGNWKSIVSVFDERTAFLR